MRIKKISFKNFRLFENLEIEFPDENFIVLIGNNGSGKTSILDGIADCLEHFVGKLLTDAESHQIERYLMSSDISENFGRSEIDTIIDFENTTLKFSIAKTRNIQGTEYKIDQEEVLIKSREDIKRDIKKSVPIFYYYGIKRSDYPGRTYNATKKQKNGVLDTYEKHKNTSNIANFEEWFVAESIDESILKNGNPNYESASLRNCRDALNNFLQLFDFGITSFKLKKIDGQKFIPNSNLEYFFGVEKNGTTLIFNQLSSGERAVIHLIADISRRLSIANSHSDVSNSGSGVILLDEIDLHFHPSWQSRIMVALEATFPNVQFIVTTHSPLVLSGIPKKKILILHAGRVLSPDKIPDMYGATADEIYEKLFLAPYQDPKIGPYREKLDHLILKEEYEEAESLINELKEKFSPTSKWLSEYAHIVAFSKV